MKTKKENNWNDLLNKIENKLEEFFLGKLPSLPEKAKEIIVKVNPYFILISLLITIPAILALMGVGAAINSLSWWGDSGNKFGMGLAILVGIIMIVLEIMALPALFKNKIKGWKLLFYSSLVQAVSSILSFDLGGLIIGSGICWYILFQIKKYYR